MKTLTLTVSDEEARLLTRRAVEAGIQDVSEYVESLVRSHLEAHEALEAFMPANELEAALREGIESGNPTEWNPEFSQDVREEILKRLAERRNSQSTR